MPNLVTHTLFCEDVLDALDNPMLNAHRRFFITGGQGPDFLFFHNSTPAKVMIPSPLRKYGTLFHHESVNAFYQSALESIDRESNRSVRNDLIAYVCGHLCHWALDSTLHPLIYSRTGNCEGLSASRHHRYESLLDAAMLQYKKHTTIKDYDPGAECFGSDRETARAIAKIYLPAIESIYGESIRPYMIYDTLQDWKTMQKHFRDPKNIKKAIFTPLETITHLPNVVTGYSIPNAAEDNVDICNLLHTPWPDPVTGDISTESIFDLYEIALDKAETAITLFFKAVRSPEQVRPFLDFLADRDYDTNLAGSPEPVYFSLVDLS